MCPLCPLQEQLTAATAAMVTQGNIEAEQEAQRKREKKKAEEEARAKVRHATVKLSCALELEVLTGMKAGVQAGLYQFGRSIAKRVSLHCLGWAWTSNQRVGKRLIGY
eukprot:1131221-Pelagomonas_calceolata.AAC.1